MEHNQNNRAGIARRTTEIVRHRSRRIVLRMALSAAAVGSTERMFLEEGTGKSLMSASSHTPASDALDAPDKIAKHWINGEWVESDTVSDSINPATGEVLNS